MVALRIGSTPRHDALRPSPWLRCGGLSVALLALVALVALCGTACEPAETGDGESVEAPPDRPGEGTTESTDRTDDPQTPEADHSERVARVLELYETYNADEHIDLAAFAQDVVGVSKGSKREDVRGPEAFRDSLERPRELFSEFRLEPVRVFDAGDAVIVEAIYTGTHDKPLPGGVEPSGKRVGGRTAHVWHFDEAGRIERVDTYQNRLNTLLQLGMVDVPNMPVPPVPERPDGAPDIVDGEGSQDLVASVEAIDTASMEGELDALDALVAEDVALAGGMESGESSGRAMFKKGVSTFNRAIADQKIEYANTWPVGERFVVVAGTLSGRRGGPGGGAVKLVFDNPFLEVYEFSPKSGKLVARHGYTNPLHMMRQLGMRLPYANEAGGGGAAAADGDGGAAAADGDGDSGGDERGAWSR